MTPEQRVAELEAAITHHRRMIGVAYHYGAFGVEHTANVTLWNTIKPCLDEGNTPLPMLDPPALARPAMMEDNE